MNGAEAVQFAFFVFGGRDFKDILGDVFAIGL